MSSTDQGKRHSIDGRVMRYHDEGVSVGGPTLSSPILFEVIHQHPRELHTSLRHIEHFACACCRFTGVGTDELHSSAAHQAVLCCQLHKHSEEIGGNA